MAVSDEPPTESELALILQRWPIPNEHREYQYPELDQVTTLHRLVAEVRRLRAIESIENALARYALHDADIGKVFREQVEQERQESGPCEWASVETFGDKGQVERQVCIAEGIPGRAHPKHERSGQRMRVSAAADGPGPWLYE